MVFIEGFFMDTNRKKVLNLKILLIILYILIVVIVDALMSIQLGDHGNEKLKRVNHTNEVIIETKDFLGNIKDMETGQRGYLLTEDITYLEPYHAGLIDSKKHFNRLKQLTLDNISQVNRLELIDKLVKLKSKELKATIEAKTSDKAIMIVKRNDGKKYMDEIRSIFSTFIDKELSLLEKRKKELQDNTSKNLFIVRSIFFLLLLVVFSFVYINLSQKYKIQLINDNLELKIKEEVQKNRNKDKKLLCQSRLAQMGEMISMIAHQWRQPLGAISSASIDLKMQSELKCFDLGQKQEAQSYEEYVNNSLNDIDEFVQNLTNTIDDFRNFYKPNKKLIAVTVEDIIEKSLNIIKSSLANKSIRVIKEYNSKEKIELYDNEMMQVFLNILKNAQDNFIENSIKNPYIKIATENRRILIYDNGGGIPENIIDKIFDPYFSTKDEKNGTGLGLYMSKTIIEEHHNGKLTAKNIDEGVCFIIEF